MSDQPDSPPRLPADKSSVPLPSPPAALPTEPPRLDSASPLPDSPRQRETINFQEGPRPDAGVAEHPPTPDSPSHPFIFHGEAREYFRIWIVNTLLTILTLGVYAAWAKVRKRRYLRGSTELMGHRFDYRAKPLRILAGNVLVALMFLAYMVVGEVYPVVRGGALIAGLVLLPWVIVRSLSFNAHNTAYRGMRFYFRQTYGWTGLVYLGQWFFIMLSLGLYYPAWVRNRKEFAISNHRLGDAFFRFESKSGPFYAAYLIGGLFVMLASAGGGMISYLNITANHGKLPSTLQLLPVVLLYGFGLYCSKHYIYARLFNQIWNHTRLDDHRFQGTLEPGAWMKLQLVNLGAIIVSCGLLYPWATIRSARLALSHLHFVPAGPVEKISRLGKNDGSALGETAAEFVGLDIGL